MSNTAAAVPGFFKHAELDLRAKRMITRSAALYWATEDDATHTDLLIFNYWLHKNNITDPLQMVVTLRTLDGTVVVKQSRAVDFKNAFTLRVRDVLAADGQASPFEGSVELEILGDRDLVVPYPAVIVRYYGESWHSMTHTSPRILSESSGDERDRIEGFQHTNEGNWTIQPPERGDAFFVIHNGARAVEPHDLLLALTNNRGEILPAIVEGVAYRPFETRVFWLKDHLDVGHLHGRPGSLSVETVINCVYPRMICGTRSADGAMTVDHSNFNYTGDIGLADTSPIESAGSIKPLGFFVPTPTGEKWRCYVDVYPTYPERNYSLHLRALDLSGREIATRDLVIGGAGPRATTRLDLTELLRGAENGGAVDMTVTHEARVPNRFHMGVHYEYDGGLPGYTIDGPFPYWFKGTLTRWMPIFAGDDTRSFVMIANQIFDRAHPRDVTFELSFHSAKTDEIKTRSLLVEAGKSFVAPIHELLPDAEEFLGDEAGWMMMKASVKNHSVIHYAALRGRDSVAADHAF